MTVLVLTLQVRCWFGLIVTLVTIRLVQFDDSLFLKFMSDYLSPAFKIFGTVY